MPSVLKQLSIGGSDSKLRRLVTYWLMTVGLYALCTLILWTEVWAGQADAPLAAALTVLAVGGHTVFYVLIRFSLAWQLTPAQLSVYQGRFAIICVILGYAIVGPLRGATLLVLLVVLVFCAFTLEARKTRALSLFAVAFLGIVMLVMVAADPVAYPPMTELKHFVLVGTMVAVVGYLTGTLSELRSTLKAQKAELSEALGRIQELATTDELTLLPNRRRMTSLMQSRPECGETACLALIDIDFFKRINDTYGHAAGDEVLREFGVRARHVLRAGDVLSRWGGEEFLLFLPQAGLEAARAVLARLRQELAGARFTHGGERFSVSFSAGLVALCGDETFDAALARADALLYEAKAAGRDRVMAQPSA